MDEWAQVRLGDWVQATTELRDEMDNVLVAKKGDLGHVIGKEVGCFPTVHWERSGRVLDASPDEEFEVLCEADFAKTPSKTPKKARRAPLKRGAA